MEKEVRIWIVIDKYYSISLVSIKATKKDEHKEYNKDGSLLHHSNKYVFKYEPKTIWIREGKLSAWKLGYDDVKEYYCSLSGEDAINYRDKLKDKRDIVTFDEISVHDGYDLKNIQILMPSDNHISVSTRPIDNFPTTKWKTQYKKMDEPEISEDTEFYKMYSPDYETKKHLFIIHLRRDHPTYSDITMIGIINETKKQIQIGLSFCHAKDNFSKRIGRESAFKRAINNPIILPYTKQMDPKVVREFLYHFAEMIKENKDFLVETLYEFNKK